MHKSYVSKSEDINALDALPAGAVRNPVFYDGAEKRRSDLLSRKGLVFSVSNPEFVNNVAKHLMVYIHMNFNNGGDYRVREPVYDKKVHDFGIPPASVFLMPHNSKGKPHHIFEIESIYQGARFDLQKRIGNVEVLVHAPEHRREVEARTKEYEERLNQLLRSYGDLLLSKIPKKNETAPIWWPFPNIPYRLCTDC